MSDLPPDVDALAGLYGIERREDGLSVPQRVEPTPEFHSTTMRDDVFATIRGPSPTGVWVDDMLEASRQYLERERLAWLREVAQSTAERYGGAAWVDTTDESLAGGEIGVIRLVTWLSNLGPGAERVLLCVSSRVPAWTALRPLIGTTHDAPLGPPLPCELHEDCRAAYRSGVAEQREMALACMEAGR